MWEAKMRGLIRELFFLSVCLTPVLAQGATIDNWLTSSSSPVSWNAGANWSTGNPPQATQAAVFPNGSLPGPTNTSITLDGSQTLYGIYLTPGSSGPPATA